MIDAQWFTELKNWQRGKESRALTIEMGSPGDNGRVQVWAYDYSLMEGQRVTFPEIPNIEANVDREEREEYERLRAKYE